MIQWLISLLYRTFPAKRIDTHIHLLTPSYVKALEENGGDPSGWQTPKWNIEDCFEFTTLIDNTFSVLSVTAPGATILGPTKAGSELARKINDESWNICESHPDRFGFFASLPDLRDVEGTLNEIDNIFAKEKKANGVIIFTSYGDKLPGDKEFDPIWKALNDYNALVFIHPGHAKIQPENILGFLPQPVIDYPQQTTRAAASLALSGVVTKYSKIDFILSHGGGTLPFLGQRLIGSLLAPEIGKHTEVNVLQLRSALKKFHFDLALSTSTPQLRSLLSFAGPDRILFGSDYPYAPSKAIFAGILQYAQFAASSSEGSLIRPRQLSQNAFNLLSKHKLEHCNLPKHNDSDHRAAQPSQISSEPQSIDEDLKSAKEILSKL